MSQPTKPTETDSRRKYRALVAHRQALLSLSLMTLRYQELNDASKHHTVKRAGEPS